MRSFFFLLRFYINNREREKSNSDLKIFNFLKTLFTLQHLVFFSWQTLSLLSKMFTYLCSIGTTDNVCGSQMWQLFKTKNTGHVSRSFLSFILFTTLTPAQRSADRPSDKLPSLSTFVFRPNTPLCVTLYSARSTIAWHSATVWSQSLCLSFL